MTPLPLASFRALSCLSRPPLSRFHRFRVFVVQTVFSWSKPCLRAPNRVAVCAQVRRAIRHKLELHPPAGRGELFGLDGREDPPPRTLAAAATPTRGDVDRIDRMMASHPVHPAYPCLRSPCARGGDPTQGCTVVRILCIAEPEQVRTRDRLTRRQDGVVWCAAAPLAPPYRTNTAQPADASWYLEPRRAPRTRRRRQERPIDPSFGDLPSRPWRSSRFRRLGVVG